MTATDQDKFAGGVREAVREALAEKEEAERLSKVEDLLNTAEATINGLTDTISQKDEELASVADQRDSLKTLVEELQTKATELDEKLAQAEEEKRVIEERASVAEQELASLEANRRLAARVSELEEVKVLKSDEEKRVVQTARIRDLSDEEFASYKEELVELRSDLEEELRKEAAEATDVGDDTDGAVAAAGGDVVEVAPADLGNKETASAAAAALLNIEVPSEDITSKFQAFANQMAKQFVSDRG